MEPEFTVKTLCPVIHITPFSPRRQAQTPSSLHLSPAHICTAVRIDGGSAHSTQQLKPGVVAPPKRGSVSQLTNGNICNSALPLESLTRALLMAQRLNKEYSRVIANVASQDEEEACLRQKFHPPKKGLRAPPSFSTALYD